MYQELYIYVHICSYVSSYHAPFQLGPNGTYLYTDDLLSLESSTLTSTLSSDPLFSGINTPLSLPSWCRRLESHPDKNYTSYILRGIKNGFFIGRNPTHPLRSASENLPSAYDNPQAIEDYLQKESSEGRIFGPFSPCEVPHVHINKLKAIPKRHQPGQWRVITNLSYPEGSSVNDSIDSSLCSVKYITVEQVAKRAFSLGKGSRIAKIDIKAAYRLIPVSPHDRRFLGMEWNNGIYVDGMLPFGVRSAPKIFSAVADAVEWCVAKENVNNIYHYLDDFVVIGPPNSEDCASSLQKLKSVCEDLGIPLASEKEAGPSTNIEFLGFVIDTVKQELQLPKDKLQRLLNEVQQWEARESCTKRELESFIGIVRHASKVLQPGHSFLSTRLSEMVKQQHSDNIRLNACFHSNVVWWRVFATHWNGCALMLDHDIKIELTSDASGDWGYGACYDKRWFHLQWNDGTRGFSTIVKELIPIIIATVIWGPEWKGCTVVAKCSNNGVVRACNSCYSEEPHIMHMLRSLFFITACLQFKLVLEHIPDPSSSLARNLSRNQLDQFLPTSSPVPPSILQWLLDPNMDWTSSSWTQNFATFVHSWLVKN